MLQTIYETDSCVSSDGVAGREQLLAQQRMHSMISSGMISFRAGMFMFEKAGGEAGREMKESSLLKELLFRLDVDFFFLVPLKCLT